MFVVDTQTRQAVEYWVRGLETFHQNQAIRAGLQRAAKVFEREARANLAVRLKDDSEARRWQTGELLRSFATRVEVGRRRDGALAVTGHRLPGGYTAHWLDLGTGPRYTKSGAYRGFVTPTHYFTDARAEGEREATNELLDGIQQAIAQINNRR